ncbi:MAG: hypothetical protein CMI03_18045 [Oceanospirillaceae bacterium]|nr:hypothetical protein [Oceanospirillaceae bacterium]MBL35640.1 hypothetical protein [Oceanospirillaceae bacterium]MBS52986.1 hypothetical protein [Oceanospirillaceae bacterium]MBS54643.1 hypothetical protein [Oceanospirillaceae bacterium]
MHTAHTDYWRSLCLILLLMVSVTTYAAADSIHTSSVLQDGPLAGQPLGKYLDVYHQRTPLDDGLMVPADGPGWQRSESDVPNYGLLDYPVWYRLRLEADKTTGDLLANISIALLDHIELFITRDDQLIFHEITGDHLPFSQRPLKLREFVIPLPELTAGTYTLYFRVDTQGSMQFPLQLWQDEEYHNQATDEYITIGIFIGLLVSVAFYNSFIYFTTREAYAIGFVGHILSYLVFFISLTGIGYQYVYNDSHWLQERMINVSASAAGVFACLFARYFLYNDLIKYRWLNRLSLFNVAISLVSLLATVTLSYTNAIESVIMQAVFTTASTLVIGLVIAIIHPSLSNMLYLLGWTSILAGVFFHALAKQGLIELTPLVNYASHIGTLIMVSSHSLEIALRFHETKQEKMETEKRLLAAQSESMKSRYLMHEAELKRQKTEAENEAKSAFLAAMSHEIRTPLNGVLGMLQLMKDTELSAQQRRYLDIINNSGESLLTIVNDILDLSKMNSGKLQLEIREINLHEVITDCANLYSRQAMAKGLSLVVNASPPLNTHIVTDSTRLRQVINNLLSNAVKFTEAGYVLLNARADGERVKICVKDTGIGIPEEFRERLFDHFSQADASTSRNYGGTGLGLSISKKLVELLQGEITMHSEAEGGTEFCIQLNSCHADMPVNTDAIRTMKIRVALQLPCERDTVEHFLRELGCTVLTANDPQTADAEITDSLPTQAAEVKTLCLQNEEAEAVANTIVIPRPLNTLTLLSHLLSCSENTETRAEKNIPLASYSEALIWIAEDNLVNQKVITGMLRHLGYKFLLFNDGQAIVNAWQQQSRRPDLILMDCEMPIMDGFEATHIITADNDIAACPVLALTAHVLPEYQHKAKEAGFSDFIAKPIRREILSQTLQKWLTKSAAPVNQS